MRIEEGKILGDWRLLKQAGVGSLGDVCIAEHRFTKKKAALKILPADMMQDKGFVVRFEDEVLHLSQFDHPSLARVLNVSFADGVYFLAMECVVDSKLETSTLASFMKRQKLEERQVVSIIEQVASALDYIHEIKSATGRAVAHMNLKPSNILIADRPFPYIEIKVTDFGLPRIIGQPTLLQRGYKALVERYSLQDPLFMQKFSLDRYSLGATDGRMYEMLVESCCQTLHFLPPEQLRGDMAFPREGDVWSFGVLIFWMLTGGLYPLGNWREYLPSSDTFDWEALLNETLHLSPKNRSLGLLECLKKCKRQEAPALQEVAPPVQEPLVMHSPPVHVMAVEEVSCGERLRSESDMYTVREFQPEKLDTCGIEPLKTDMVTISGDVYTRGSTHGCRDEMPRHQVRLNSFSIDVHPVTNEQFVLFLNYLGTEKDSHNHDIIRLKDSRIKRSSGRFSIERGYTKHPVVGVTWYGAQAYAAWIGKRLPTEAEWEISCTGGLESPLYPTGEKIEKPQANFFSSDTTPVMSYPPNEFGLFDMAGNVYEWCHDWYEYNYYDYSAQEPDNPKGPIQGVYRVLRGGCWKSLKEDLRCAKRHRNKPGAANGTYGFRCASDGE